MVWKVSTNECWGEVAIKGHEFTMTFRCLTLHRPMPRRFLGASFGCFCWRVIFGEIWDLCISMIYFVDFFKQAQDENFEYWTATVHLANQSSAETYCTGKCWNFSIFAKEAAMAMRRVGMPQNSLDFFMLCWTCHFVLPHHPWWNNGVKFEQTWQESSEQKVRIDPKPVWIPTENQPYQLLHRNMSKVLSIFV